MRRWTLLTIIALFLLIGAAAAYQVALASRDQAPFPGPVTGTPLPEVSPEP